MNRERWQRIDALFHRAVDLAESERAALLERECGADPELREEVERLLKSDSDTTSSSGSDLFSRIETQSLLPVEDPLIGRTLGVYRVTERLGSGGMGVVYRGTRDDGLFEQEVAIKLIRSERATEWMVRRFEFERRMLAALVHPCIARLYDGGTTEDGSPYFVMELVRGEPINRACEQRRLSVEAKLRLFVEVCRAVQFAHQSLVVHCDLKPANILIDEHGTPRLLDFGIARFLEEAPADSTNAATRTVARVLTPEYASPEQLAGGAVTTSLDVYSLGVVLYELLTGSLPLQSDSRTLSDWERMVREEAPQRPSTRVFGGDRAALGGALRGDLDRIVLMALRKEPERRYASVQEFADDIERHLSGQPVRARPNSIGYLTAKFVGRNRIAVAASMAVLGALLLGLIAARRSEGLAAAEAAHARMEAESFQSIASFLMDGFLPAQPAQDRAWQARARERVIAQAERVRRQYAGVDHVRANLIDTLGQVCMRLDLREDAERLMEEALAIRTESFGAGSLEQALSLRSLGQLAYDSGDFTKAASLLEQALHIHRAAGTNPHADVASIANDLAACLRNIGREEESESLHREALALRRANGDGTLPVAESLNNLAAISLARGDFSAAVAGLKEALMIRERVLGPDHLLSAQTLSNLATARWRNDERPLAIEQMKQAESAYRALGGDGEDGLALALGNLSAMQMAEKDLDGAATSIAEGLALQTKRLPANHPLIAATLINLAVLHHARHADDEAGRCWEEAIRIRRVASAPPRELAEALYGYGVLLSDIGRCEHATPLLEEAISLHRDHALDDAAALGRAERVLGSCLAQAGAIDAARMHLTEAVRLLESSPKAAPAERARTRERLEALDRTAKP